MVLWDDKSIVKVQGTQNITINDLLGKKDKIH